MFGIDTSLHKFDIKCASFYVASISFNYIKVCSSHFVMANASKSIFDNRKEVSRILLKRTARILFKQKREAIRLGLEILLKQLV